MISFVRPDVGLQTCLITHGIMIPSDAAVGENGGTTSQIDIIGQENRQHIGGKMQRCQLRLDLRIEPVNVDKPNDLVA